MSEWNEEFYCQQCNHWYEKFKEARMDLHYNDCNIPTAEKMSEKIGSFYKPAIVVDKYAVLDIQKQLHQLKQRLSEAEKVIDFYADKNSWNGEVSVWLECISMIDIDKISEHEECGGKRAREYREKYSNPHKE